MLIFLLLFSVDHLILSHSNCFSYCSPPTFLLFEMSVIPNSPLFSQQWFWEPPCWGAFQMCVWLWMGDFGLPCSLTPLFPPSGLLADPSSSSSFLGIWLPGRITRSSMSLRLLQGELTLSVLGWPQLHLSSENDLKSPKPPSSSAHIWELCLYPSYKVEAIQNRDSFPQKEWRIGWNPWGCFLIRGEVQIFIRY